MADCIELKEKHKFFLESIWQGRFARKYKCRYYNVCLREYTDDAATSLMRSAKTRTYYLNMFINYKMELDEQLDYKVKAPKVLMSNILIVSILRKNRVIFYGVNSQYPFTLFEKCLYINPTYSVDFLAAEDGRVKVK